MPMYEFECQKCHHKFSSVETFQEHSEHKEACPKCHSKDIRQLISVVFARTSKKS
jgi:putative FmdB family regulatory protein